jgi:hypothetical protein
MGGNSVAWMLQRNLDLSQGTFDGEPYDIKVCLLFFRG